MRKLNLVALSYDRDAILNTLEETEAVEVKLHAETEGTSPLPSGGEELSAYLSTLEAALENLTSVAESYAKEHKLKSELPQDGFEVSYSEFCAAKDQRAETDELVREINALLDARNELNAEYTRLARTIAQAQIYASLKTPFDAFSDTRHTKMRLGVVSSAAWEEAKKSLGGLPLTAYEEQVTPQGVLVTLVAHAEESVEAEGILQSAGFTPCPFTGGQTGEELYAELNRRSGELETARREKTEALVGLSSKLRNLKIYCDWVGFELEKARLSEMLRGTERTFLLEAFVPAEREESVKAALESMQRAVYYEFSDPAEDEFVPTLLKNNKVVRNFEAITNMYSAPDSREFDPNTIMSFFYSVFLGFIMADVGYGILMLLGGGFLYWKNRAKAGGIKSLAGVFAIGGVFAIIWGVLFNSILGMQFLPFTVMPDAQSESWKFVGIDIPSMLIVSMLIGIVQIFAGYVCKAYQEWRVGRFWDGVFDGVTWAVFSVGMGLAVVGLVEKFALPALATVGGIIAASALLVSVLTAGRKERFLGKFTKGFGALYGIINYISDILSYARLYGLMLSGAVIAQIISQYGVQFMTGGNIAFAVLGVVLMVVGHLFNLAMGLLGAYIHDARLQYVEFYGRFYHGEGELFTPLGSKRKYISLNRGTDKKAA